MSIMARFIIAYNSTTGNTKAMADAIVEGAKSLKLDAVAVDAFDVKVEDLLAADAVGFGVPTFNYHPAKPILRLLDDLAGRDVKGKIAVVFGSYGWSGQGPVLVAERLRQMGFTVLDPVIRVKYQPTENELFGCSLLGKDVAMQLKNIKKTVSLDA
ncbi:MAG: Type A flavoprotein FprA [Methanocella sp. PtaU1.Bin125]|nr:MAG: Type A flavoprotein FprA [Methanocella sp. PtaU1.Bin125]